MTDPNPILLKVKKLLALANDGGATEAEAALAAAKVQELLQDYGLTMAQVESTTDAQASDRAKTTTDRRAMHLYHRNLMAALADNNFCLHKVVTVRNAIPLYSGGRGSTSKSHLLVGRQLNIDVTLMTYDYLLTALKRLNPYVDSKIDRARFYDGAVARLVERLAERRREREAASQTQPSATNGSGRELVLTDVYGSEADLNNDALNGFPPGTTASKNRERAAKRQRDQETHDRLVAEGVDSDVAWFRAYGYSEETAQRSATRWKRTSWRSRSRGWTRNDQAHYAKVNSRAYLSGRDAGDEIGLDDQLAAANAQRRIAQ